jgi:predicted nicotinamide N-methyase
MIGILSQYFSFKDQAARVVKKDGQYFRYIFTAYQEEYAHLMTSGLYSTLVERHLLIPHQEIEALEDCDYKIILPEQINFLSLPFEWCYSQWLKVVLAYLEINLVALEHGMILKDATPYNFFLKKGEAILFDTSSFVFFNEPDYWISYRQFCEEMLGPIALMHYKGVDWGRLTLASHQGFSLDFISQNLPTKTWLNLSCLLHLHLHAKAYHKPSKEKNSSKGFTKEKLIEVIRMIKTTIESWEDYCRYPAYWEDYYEIDIETSEYIADKENTINEILGELKPKRVLDLGANTGKFSEIACKIAENVIALEFDKNCVDKIEKRIKETQNEKLHTILGDLSQTSPDFGLLGKEHLSIFHRAKSDIVMALALTHHLALTKMIPFELIIELLYEFSSRYVLVEFIEKTDRKVIQLLQNNPRYYPSKEEFELIIKQKFTLLQQKLLDKSVRTLYLLEKC